MERERERERGIEKKRERDRGRERGRERERERERERDKERNGTDGLCERQRCKSRQTLTDIHENTDTATQINKIIDVKLYTKLKCLQCIPRPPNGQANLKTYKVFVREKSLREEA